MEGRLGEKLRELIERASQEASKGIAWAMERVVVVGRKEGVVEEMKVVEQEGEGGLERRGVGVDPVFGGGNGDGNGKMVVGGKGEMEVQGKRARKRSPWLKIWKKLSLGRRG